MRKYQIDYDENVCMVEKYPEAMQTQGVILTAKCQNDINYPGTCQTEQFEKESEEDPDKCQNYINNPDFDLPVTVPTTTSSSIYRSQYQHQLPSTGHSTNINIHLLFQVPTSKSIYIYNIY